MWSVRRRLFDDVKNESVRLAPEARDDLAKSLVLLNLSIGRGRAAAEAADLAESPNLRHFNRAAAAFHGGDLASFRSEMSLVTSETFAGDSRVFYLVEAGQLDGAEWELDHGIGVQMNPDAVQIERAKIAMATGNRDLALSLLLAANPPPSMTLKFELLARVYFEQGDRARAIVVLEESLNHRIRPDLAHWWMRNELQLAELYHEAGRDADARPLERKRWTSCSRLPIQIFPCWSVSKRSKRGRRPSCSRLFPKRNPLRQRQRVRPVDRVRLPAHVGFPRVGSGLAAAAGFLFAAERAADLGARRADVDVGDAAVRSARGEELFSRAHALGEDRARQALRHVVVHRASRRSKSSYSRT